MKQRNILEKETICEAYVTLSCGMIDIYFIFSIYVYMTNIKQKSDGIRLLCVNTNISRCIQFYYVAMNTL